MIFSLEKNKKRIRLIFVTTVPGTFGFLRGQIGYLRDRGFDIHGVSSPGERLEEVAEREKIPVHAVAMTREVTPVHDLGALGKMVRLFLRLRPDVVNASTPKAGFLGVLAARLARVPIIIYTARGLRYVSAEGSKRQLLMKAEKLACLCAHRVIATNFPAREQLIEDGLCPAEKVFVIGQGTGNGIDARGLFNPHNLPEGTRNEVRQQYDIPPEALLLGYVGRIVREKGIMELAQAWKWLRSQYPSLRLMLVGQEEEHDPVHPQILGQLKGDDRVRFTGRVNDMPRFYAAMDTVVLSSYREGIAIAPIEANAMLLPAVTTQVGGESVVDGVTGLTVPPRDSQALAQAIKTLIDDPELRARMGQAGRERVLRDFRPEDIWQGMYEHYLDLLARKNFKVLRPGDLSRGEGR